MLNNVMTAPDAACAERIVRLFRMVQSSPQDPDAHCDVASLFMDLERYDDAIGAALTATTLAPHSPRAQADLGRALFLKGTPEAALGPCALSVALAPRDVGAVVTFGATLFALGRLELALEAALDAVALDPEHYQARVNLALAFEALGDLDRAETQARRAVAIDPTPSARHNLASLLLSRGVLSPESWRLYDARLELTARSRALADIPRWKGQELPGGTILLHAEQGFGDVLQFVRYAPLVKQRVGRVLLAAPGPLRRLLASVSGIDEVVEPGTTRHFDAFCPVASLPSAFDTELATIPAAVPYLAPPPGTSNRLRSMEDGLLRVGLAWSGNPNFVHDRHRSLPPALLCELRCIPGISFHSLQKDGAAPFPMADRMRDVGDFADTAAMIADLDLVISVDTAVAHLAGALGKPVWLLSRFMGCWRWLRDREDSPWYPTMRIFRQPAPGEWVPVVDAISSALRLRAADRAA